MNVSGSAVDLTDWTVTDGPTEGTITLSDTLAAGASIWIAREADDFTLEFGFPPCYEYGVDNGLDNINSKKVMYPGWDLERYFRTEAFTETANLTHALALSFPCHRHPLTKKPSHRNGTHSETGRAYYPGASDVVILERMCYTVHSDERARYDQL
jgi:hypothetical protein